MSPEQEQQEHYNQPHDHAAARLVKTNIKIAD